MHNYHRTSLHSNGKKNPEVDQTITVAVASIFYLRKKYQQKKENLVLEKLC